MSVKHKYIPGDTAPYYNWDDGRVSLVDEVIMEELRKWAASYSPLLRGAMMDTLERIVKDRPEDMGDEDFEMTVLRAKALREVAEIAGEVEKRPSPDAAMREARERIERNWNKLRAQLPKPAKMAALREALLGDDMFLAGLAMGVIVNKLLASGHMPGDDLLHRAIFLRDRAYRRQMEEYFEEFHEVRICTKPREEP